MYSMQYLEHIFAYGVFTVHLKFKFNWKFCNFPGILILEEFYFDCTWGSMGLIVLPMDLSPKSFSHDNISTTFFRVAWSLCWFPCSLVLVQVLPPLGIFE